MPDGRRGGRGPGVGTPQAIMRETRMTPTLGPATGLDRASDRRSDREYMDGLLSADNVRFLVMANSKPVVISDAERTHSAIRWFTGKQVADMGLAVHEAIFLGIDPQSGAGHFAIATTEHYARNAPVAKELLSPIVDLRSLAAQGTMQAEELAVVSQAVSMANWHDNHRCCGRCGGSMTNKDGGWKRRCWACGNEAFPRMDPVVIMAVTDGERIVLAHEERFPDKMFSTLAGYVEPGDDIEHAVRRETLEEVGLEVSDIELVGSQPWPFPHTLMLGCIARAPAQELKVNTREVAEARWFSREEAAQMLAGKHPDGLWLPGSQSMAHVLISRIVNAL